MTTLNTEKRLSAAINLLQANRLGDALHMLMPLYEGHPSLVGAHEANAIQNDYDLMLAYLKKGFSDPQRALLYGNLVRRLYSVAANLTISWRCKNIGSYAEAYQRSNHLNMSHAFIKDVLERFVSDVALLSLEPSENVEEKSKELYVRHYTFIDRLFNQLWISLQWSDDDSDFFEKLLLSPTIDSNDALLMVSGIMIGCMNVFDIRKFRCLVHVYLNASDMRLRQRALVGWIFSVDDNITVYPEMESLIEEASTNISELYELQQQIFYCLNTDNDKKIIEKDIMPGLMKNQNLRINRFGMIEEKEDSDIDDILHPDKEDQAMEELEKTIQRMQDMQKEGTDIYFGGFSQMKRFSFFYTMSNWLLPFSANHPDLNNALHRIKGTNILDNLFAANPFCDSDKYSFTLALSHVIDRLPANILEAINAQGATIVSPETTETSRPAYIRRLYLQDLYRFFRLYQGASALINPFVTNDHSRSRCFFFSSPLFASDAADGYKTRLGWFLYKKGFMKEAEALLGTFTQDDVDTWLLRARVAMANKQYGDASDAYGKVLKQDNDSLMALQGLARCAMLEEHYEEAATLYSRLSLLRPEKINYGLNHCLCLVKLARYEEALRLCYQLNYERPEHDGVSRILAWTLLCTGKTDQAAKIYERLKTNNPEPEDLLNYAYCRWMQNSIDATINLLRAFIVAENEKGNDGNKLLEQELNNDRTLLNTQGISDIDILLVQDILKAN